MKDSIVQNIKGKSSVNPISIKVRVKKENTPSSFLALRASGNGLTVSPFVLYDPIYSSGQHPSPARGCWCDE